MDERVACIRWFPFSFKTPLILGRFKLQWRNALVGQEFQTKTRLFEATVGIADKMEKEKEKGGKNPTSSWSYLEAKFLVREFEVVQETT